MTNNEAFSGKQYESVNAQSRPRAAPGSFWNGAGCSSNATGDECEAGSLGGQMDVLRLHAVKWSLFHRPLAAARLMAELSVLLSSIMYLRNAGL